MSINIMFLIAFCLTVSYGLLPAAYASEAFSEKKIEKIELKEAVDAALVYLELRGKEDKTMDITVEKRFPVPLIIIIHEGTTTFKYATREHSFVLDKEMELDLSEEVKGSLPSFPQVGRVFLTRGSATIQSTLGRYSYNTGLYLKKLERSQNQRDQIFDQLLDVSKVENPYIRMGAVEALGGFRDKRAIQPLKDILEKDPDAIVRNAAKESLEKIYQENQGR